MNTPTNKFALFPRDISSSAPLHRLPTPYPVINKAFCTGTAPIMADEPLHNDDIPKFDIIVRNIVDGRNGIASTVGFDVIFIDVGLATASILGIVLAWRRVKTVSIGWMTKTEIPPEIHPATKSIQVSDIMVVIVVWRICCLIKRSRCRGWGRKRGGKPKVSLSDRGKKSWLHNGYLSDSIGSSLMGRSRRILIHVAGIAPNNTSVQVYCKWAMRTVRIACLWIICTQRNRIIIVKDPPWWAWRYATHIHHALVFLRRPNIKKAAMIITFFRCPRTLVWAAAFLCWSLRVVYLGVTRICNWWIINATILSEQFFVSWQHVSNDLIDASNSHISSNLSFRCLVGKCNIRVLIIFLEMKSINSYYIYLSTKSAPRLNSAVQLPQNKWWHQYHVYVSRETWVFMY